MKRKNLRASEEVPVLSIKSARLVQKIELVGGNVVAMASILAAGR